MAWIFLMERVSSPLTKMCWELNLFSFTEFEFDTELLDMLIYMCARTHIYFRKEKSRPWPPGAGLVVLTARTWCSPVEQEQFYRTSASDKITLWWTRQKQEHCTIVAEDRQSHKCCSLSHKNGQTPLYSGSCEWPLLLEQLSAAYFSCTFVYPPSKVIPTEGVRKDASCQVLCILPLPWAAHPACIRIQVCSWWSWAGETHNI